MHGDLPAHRFFPYLTWPMVEAMPDKDNVVIVQPIGAIEQHGPHLPLIVDAAIATTVVGKALTLLPETIPAYALPPLCYGKSNEHWHFPGTITLSAQTLRQVLMESAESFYRAGFRKLVWVNGHGGQPQVLDMAARDLHQMHSDLSVFPLFVWNVPNPAAEMLTPKELELGIHAGDAETSLMLSILPDQVCMDKAICEYPQGLPQNSLLSMEGALPFAWVTRDLTRSGVLGDATVATRQKGDRLLAALAQGWVEVIQEVHRFQQPSAWTKGKEGGD
ncbi:creatininase family protein [Oscillatoria sp. CS-180]|uniref:creatininase family protein n=1 Tax=Oscillatoria sp. CS-180 TaxID=3021720 RepID=UPI00232BAE74|nr:creatininase family protein [Oscillatoria sp. CS-180]MDB9526061.1 creatininase family protein [Oscillatoria sp. CS-180]